MHELLTVQMRPHIEIMKIGFRNHNNTCLINSAAPEYASFNPGIGGDAWPEMHDNRVYTLDGNASESGGSIASWQAQGVDVGTTIARMPSDDAIIAMGRAVLQM